MQLHWQVDPVDAARVRAFVDRYRDDAFVRYRVERNVTHPATAVALEDFWLELVGCLLTTQQRSGPDSPVMRFLGLQPFPLSYAICASRHDLLTAAVSALQSVPGIRRYNIIANQIAANRDLLARGLWEELQAVLATLYGPHAPEAERTAATFIDEHLSGFGPKQSRNLLQGLGLTQYEIPIDSRVVRWLNDFGFPLPLSAFVLSDVGYYTLVSEGIQALCRAAGVLPCVLDAAMFISFDRGWTKNHVQWWMEVARGGARSCTSASDLRCFEGLSSRKLPMRER
jgi:hypothetical protein